MSCLVNLIRSQTDMAVKQVSSSMMSRIAHCPSTCRLFVEFNNQFGKLNWYQYKGVAKDAFEAFAAAPSVGQHFHDVIRGVYVATKLSQADFELEWDRLDVKYAINWDKIVKLVVFAP